MANFKVEVLVKTIDELQKEKSKNEQVLAKECAKRKKIEQTADNFMSALAQASDRNVKMKAELKLEEQGQEQTQRQIDRFEEINESIRQRIAYLNQQVKEIEDKRRLEQETFEHRMTELIDKFRSGWQCMDGSSQEEETNYEDEITSMLERTRIKKETLESLMSKLNYARSSEFNMAGGIPDHVWETASTLFEDENKSSKITLEKLQKELCLETLEAELTKLTESN